MAKEMQKDCEFVTGLIGAGSSDKGLIKSRKSIDFGVADDL